MFKFAHILFIFSTFSLYNILRGRNKGLGGLRVSLGMSRLPMDADYRLSLTQMKLFKFHSS